MSKPDGYEEILVKELCELRDSRDYYISCLDTLLPYLDTEEGAKAIKNEKKHNQSCTVTLNKCLAQFEAENCVSPAARFGAIRSSFEDPKIYDLRGQAKDAHLLKAAMKVSDGLFSTLRLAWTAAKRLDDRASSDYLSSLVSDELQARDQMKDAWHRLEALSDQTVNA